MTPARGQNEGEEGAPPLEEEAGGFDAHAFRGALGCFATGITVVTAIAPSGELLGITANSFNSVSLDPPLVLFSLHRAAYSLGAFTDGGFRDSAEIASLGFPAYHNRPSAPTNLTLHQAIEINVPIGCGDAPVFPGDVVLGDQDGVIIIPAHLADEIANEAHEMTAFEDFVTEEVRGGRSIRGLYPATEEKTLTDFAAWRKKNNR